VHTVEDRSYVSDYPAPSKTATKSAGTKYTIVGLVCAIAALVIVPILFGPIGAVFGFIGYAKGDKRGLWVGIGAIAATFLGILIGALVFHAAHHTQPAR
jgi:hypothetical protein